MKIGAIAAAKAGLALKVFAPLGAASIAVLAVLDAPPFGNPWFDLVVGPIFFWLVQCSAMACQYTETSSEPWKAFCKLIRAFSGVTAILSHHLLEKLEQAGKGEK